MPLVKKFNLLSAAVAAAVPGMVFLGLTASARAQFQDTTGGHALDANNRVGSGGYNGAATPHYDYNVNNNIVTGNVSGLNYFHGNKTTEFDPNVFQGNTGSSSFDNFNAVSSPSNVTQRTTGQPHFTQYYNTGNQVGAPPTNYVSTPGGVGYIPAPTVSPLTPTGYDARINQVSTDPTKGNLLSSGEMNVSGPVDPSSGNASIYSMSPLYGVRAADGTQQSSMFNSQTTNTRTLTPADRAKMTPADIQKMRDELNTTVVPNSQNGQLNNSQNPGQNGAQNGTNPNQPQTGQTNGVTDLNVGKSQQLTTIAPQSNNLSANQALSSSLSNSQVGNSLNSGQGLQNQLVVPPAKQSKQLADLERRFSQDKAKPTDVEATERLNAEIRAQHAPSQTFDASARPKPGETPSATGDNTSAKPAPQPILTKPDLSSGQDNQPYVITSLASGINAKGLAGLMKTAEDQMRSGKFTEAVDTYDTAEMVAPNNPFVVLGRGFAEMGAAYYGKADKDLNSAFSADPAVLLGKYDLKGFLGEDRVKFVHDDLEDIANQEKGARPLVLLAFIAHNGGDDALASKDLAEAERRGGYADLVKAMRDAWKIQ
jgi:hypothetical protein